MRGPEWVGRERAAFSLADAYASSLPASCSLSPTRTGASGMGVASRRPMSARSASSRRVVVGRSAVHGRASSARSRVGWASEADEQLSLGIDFRRRREDTARKRKTMMLGGGPGRDLEDIEDENRRLKVALCRAIDENKRYRVNKMRLEGELLRADGKIDLLLAELQQTPGNRDQRLLRVARSEMEKCAVVRMLAKQKEHLQQLLACQQQELDMIKQTKEWSAVIEMTTATEEYFVEIQRLQRLLAQEQHRHTTTLAESPSSFNIGVGESTREECNPNQGTPNGRRSSGVDETVWTNTPGARENSLLVSSPIHGGQDAQEGLAVDVCRVHHQQTSASAAGDNIFATVEHREDSDLVMPKRGVWMGRELHRRSVSPQRRASPPRRAQMVARTSREAENLHSSGKTAHDHPGNGWRRRRSVVEKGEASRSQAPTRAALAVTGQRGSDLRPGVAGVKGRRPFSAPRRTRETQKKNVGGVRRAASASLAGRAAAGSGTGGSSRVGGGASRQRGTRDSPSLTVASRDCHSVSSVAVLETPLLAEKDTTRKSRLDPRPRSASPRVGSSSNSQETTEIAGSNSHTPRNDRDRSDSTKEHRGSQGRKYVHDPDAVVGGSNTDSPTAAASQTSHNMGLGASKAPASQDQEDQTDDSSRDDQRGSSSRASRESLASTALRPTAAVAKAAALAIAAAQDAETDSPTAEVAMTKGRKEATSAKVDDHGQNHDTDEHGRENRPPGYSENEIVAATDDDESRAVQEIGLDDPGRELADDPEREISVSAPASWKSDEAVSERARATQGMEERSVHSISSVGSRCSRNSGRGSVAVETISCGGVATESESTDLTDNDVRVGETKAPVAQKTDGLFSSEPGSRRSSGSRSKAAEVPFNRKDIDRRSPPPTGGEDSMINSSASSSSPAQVMVDSTHRGEPAAKDEMNNLLFDGNGSDIARSDEVLGGDEGVVQSEYGDDFDDDFEDEGG